MARIARFIEREAAGFGGSVALGFLLGMTPTLANFFGLPIEAPHVTLSTGSLTLALSSIGVGAAGWGAVASAMLGIALIGLFNFGVSFALALVVALRARDVPRGERLTLPGAVLRRFLRRPGEFFYPPRDAGPPEAKAEMAPEATTEATTDATTEAAAGAAPDAATDAATDATTPHLPRWRDQRPS